MYLGAQIISDLDIQTPFRLIALPFGMSQSSVEIRKQLDHDVRNVSVVESSPLAIMKPGSRWFSLLV